MDVFIYTRYFFRILVAVLTFMFTLQHNRSYIVPRGALVKIHILSSHAEHL